MSPIRRSVVLTALATAGFAGVAAPAHAADAYRFWGYSHLQNGKWTMATTGPDKFTPKDGTVEGWRFALVAGTTPRMPRAVLTFDQVCGSTPAQEGKKRVGLVIDSGRTVDAANATTAVPAPKAECVVADQAATGAQVLAAHDKVRDSKGLICAINSYPATGCGDSVAAAKVTPAAKAADTPVAIPVTGLGNTASASPSASTQIAETSNSSGGSSTPKIAAMGILVALAALGVVLFRQRRNR